MCGWSISLFLARFRAIGVHYRELSKKNPKAPWIKLLPPVLWTAQLHAQAATKSLKTTNKVTKKPSGPLAEVSDVDEEGETREAKDDEDTLSCQWPTL